MELITIFVCSKRLITLGVEPCIGNLNTLTEGNTFRILIQKLMGFLF